VSARIWSVAEPIGEVNAALAGSRRGVGARRLSGSDRCLRPPLLQVKDAQANLSCGVGEERRRSRFKLTDGLAVRGGGSAATRRAQRIVEKAVPGGERLQLAFERSRRS
jgi:hypothetical protein